MEVNILPKELLFVIIDHIDTNNDLDNFINHNEYLKELFSKDDVWKDLYFQTKENRFTDSDIKDWRKYYSLKYSILKTFEVIKNTDLQEISYENIKMIKYVHHCDYTAFLIIDIYNNLFLYKLGGTIYNKHNLGILKDEIIKISGNDDVLLLTKSREVYYLSCKENKLLKMKEKTCVIDISFYRKLAGCISKTGIIIFGKSDYQRFDINMSKLPLELKGLSFKQISCSRSHVTVLTEDNEIYCIYSKSKIKKIQIKNLDNSGIKKIMSDFGVIFILTHSEEIYEISFNVHVFEEEFNIVLHNKENIKDILFTNCFDGYKICYIKNDNSIICEYRDCRDNYKYKSVDIPKKLPFPIDDNTTKINMCNNLISFVRLE